MKKLLIKVLCGILFLLCLFAGCNNSNSTNNKTSKEIEMSVATTTKEEATAKPSLSDEETILIPSTFDPFLSDAFVIEESSNMVKATEESSEIITESSIDQEISTEENSVEEEFNTIEDVSYLTEENDSEENYDNFISEEIETVEEEYLENNGDDEKEYINATYTPTDFQNMGIIEWGEWSWTFYSQRVLPGEGLTIPGRYVDYNGYVCDENDYICLASSSLDKGTVVDTPFGKMGKVYDCGCLSYILDVYVDW